jgi:hypothetical protein
VGKTHFSDSRNILVKLERRKKDVYFSRAYEKEIAFLDNKKRAGKKPFLQSYLPALST